MKQQDNQIIDESSANGIEERLTLLSRVADFLVSGGQEQPLTQAEQLRAQKNAQLLDGQGVSYLVQQSLTETQKQRGRNNLGSIEGAVYYDHEKVIDDNTIALKNLNIDSANNVSYATTQNKESDARTVAAKNIDALQTSQIAVSQKSETYYNVGDLRLYNNILYICTVAHTSEGQFNKDYQKNFYLTDELINRQDVLNALNEELLLPKTGGIQNAMLKDLNIQSPANLYIQLPFDIGANKSDSGWPSNNSIDWRRRITVNDSTTDVLQGFLHTSVGDPIRTDLLCYTRGGAHSTRLRLSVPSSQTVNYTVTVPNNSGTAVVSTTTNQDSKKKGNTYKSASRTSNSSDDNTAVKSYNNAIVKITIAPGMWLITGGIMSDLGTQSGNHQVSAQLYAGNNRIGNFRSTNSHAHQKNVKLSISAYYVATAEKTDISLRGDTDINMNKYSNKKQTYRLEAIRIAEDFAYRRS